MQYLGFVSGSSSQLTQKIQQRILQAQPILESFGNAVTMRRRLFPSPLPLFDGLDFKMISCRNNNSSRFGKYNRIFFDESGTLVHAGASRPHPFGGPPCVPGDYVPLGEFQGGRTWQLGEELPLLLRPLAF